MNANQIINMVIRQIMRRFISKGIDAGINMASRKRPKAGDDPETVARLGAEGRDNAKRAKQAMRVGRRVGRF
ncbi:MAG: hypothetical protein LJE68_15915 [Rhodobacter sp.]|nr:hypothetical protein [Rhodobacter sp.]